MMKRLNLLFVLILISGLAMAQNVKRERGSVAPEIRATRMTEKLVKNLSLTDQQAKELQAIHMEFATERKAMSEEQKEKQTKMHEQRKLAMEQYDAKLKKVLTESQYTAYQKMKTDRMAQKNSDRHKQRNRYK